MSRWLGLGVSIFFGVSSGIVIATAILAFITAIGLIPRFTAKTDTRTHYLAIGTAAVLGSSAGSMWSLFDLTMPIPKVIIGVFSLFIGMFIGCLAVALAEVLNVIPIAKNRIKLKKGMHLMMLSFAIGKLIGALYYWFNPGFIFK
ncbi:MAG: stage V sporulation protein AB [Cellulosilyticaceae bacterium]